VQQTVSGAVKEFEPFIRYGEFADWGIKFSVILRVEEFTAQYLLKHEFIKRLYARYDQEGIVVPYPSWVTLEKSN
jgi:small-conductance mechanosensitive channel